MQLAPSSPQFGDASTKKHTLRYKLPKIDYPTQVHNDKVQFGSEEEVVKASISASPGAQKTLSRYAWPAVTGLIGIALTVGTAGLLHFIGIPLFIGAAIWAWKRH
jgi:hypothetical protein